MRVLPQNSSTHTTTDTTGEKIMSEQITVEKNLVTDVVGKYFAAIRAMDLPAWLETFAEDAVTYEPVGDRIFEGHGAIAQFFAGVAGMFTTVGLTEEFVEVVGNEVAVKWIGRGVGQNGNSVTFAGIDVFEINPEGKIQTLHGYWDFAAVVKQLEG